MTNRDEDNLEKLKKEFEKVRAKYNLPGFDELDTEFEIRRIDFDLHIVREVRRSVIHKLTGVADLLEPILNPSESNLHSAIESKHFEKDDVDEMFKFYKKLWLYVHEGVVTSLVSEKEEAEFIKRMWKIWPEIKKTALEYAQKITDCWSKEDKERTTDHYLG